MFAEFHFLRPYFLLLFVVLLLVLWLAHKKNRQNNSWLKICDPSLVSHLLVGKESRASITPLVLLFITGSILILALAGPAWQKLPQPVFKNEDARVYVLDLSRSMDATDVAPSRVVRAKLKLIDFLKSHKEGQLGLIAFAAEPYVVSPLTDDANTIISMVPSLSTDIMPVQGSSPDKAILRAAQLLKQSGNPRGDIVLITDGINKDAAINAAQQSAAQSYQLHVVGVGTVDGAPIPVGQGGFLKDKNGAIVIPKLEINELRELALAGSGQYVTLAVDDSDVKRLSKSRLEEVLDKESETFRELDLWRDEGHWLVLLALPFAVLGFRRGWLGVMVISLCFMPVDESLAFEWVDLWQRKDQQAQQALEQGKAKEAAELFADKAWKGTAYYRNGDYEKAAEAFAANSALETKYNLANALAKQGKFQEAIDIYDEVIEKQPDHQDASFNRELIKKIIQQQQNNQQDQNQEQSDEQNQDSQNQQQQGEGEQNQEQQQNQQDGQSQQNQQQAQDSESGEQQNENKQAQESENNEAEKREEELRKEQESKEGEEAEQQKQQQAENELSSEEREMRQATEQWLRRIPDDPGGLMREKFHRQSQRQRQRSNVEQPW